MRGVDEFAQLWERRQTTASGISLLALPDLIRAKKTQRDKDWPMIRRLLEADYYGSPPEPPAHQIGLWLNEMRTPALLRELCQRFPSAATAHGRPAVILTLGGASDSAIADALHQEEMMEREADMQYWQPLKRQLSLLRQSPHEERKSAE
jgi:hypothetical protein